MTAVRVQHLDYGGGQHGREEAGPVFQVLMKVGLVWVRRAVVATTGYTSVVVLQKANQSVTPMKKTLAIDCSGSLIGPSQLVDSI